MRCRGQVNLGSKQGKPGTWEANRGGANKPNSSRSGSKQLVLTWARITRAWESRHQPVFSFSCPAKYNFGRSTLIQKFHGRKCSFLTFYQCSVVCCIQEHFYPKSPWILPFNALLKGDYTLGSKKVGAVYLISIGFICFEGWEKMKTCSHECCYDIYISPFHNWYLYTIA